MSMRKKLGLALIASSMLCSPVLMAQQLGLVSLSDEELSEVEGQALLSLSYIDPRDSINMMPGKGVGFYKLGLEADLELNANIRKLQLGCGGINGPGGCDIDIDHLSLSGLSESSDGRASSSAKMSNPFLQFAIKNPDSAAQREVLGVRMSAEKVMGLLTLGTENSATPNGINSFSGYMRIKDATGTASTASRSMTFADTGQSIDGRILPKIWFLPTVPIGFESTNYDLKLQATDARLAVDGQVISGTRMSNVMLKGMAYINTLNFSGDLRAKALGINLDKVVTGNITNLRADLTIDQNLGFIHKLPLNNPFSLSLQSSQVYWTGADAAAERGWWMAFDDAVDIGNITPSDKIVITNDVLKQIVQPISDYLTKNPVECQLLNCIAGKNLEVGNVNLPNTILKFPLKDLQLVNQRFAPNCYGGMKFC